MAHTPLKMTIPQAHAEVQYGWAGSYSPDGIAKAVDSLDHQPLGDRITILLARLCFRGIYFPQMGRLAWVKLIAQNRRTIFKLVKEAFGAWRGAQGNPADAVGAEGGARFSGPTHRPLETPRALLTLKVLEELDPLAKADPLPKADKTA